jgi:hypothetical protein
MGMSASTGDLADNHDLVGMRVFSSEADARDSPALATQATQEWQVPLELKGKTKKQQIDMLEGRIGEFQTYLDLTEHHLEHELLRLRDQMAHMIDKLDRAEEDMMGNIAHVEELIYMQSEIGYGSMGDDDMYFPSAFGEDERREEILAHFRQRLDDQSSDHKEAVERAISQLSDAESKRSWMLVAGAGVVLLGAFAGYLFFKGIRLHHLL